MDYRPATPGQIKQINTKVLQAVPVEAFSFEEAERLLRDHRLAHDVACLLRRHQANIPIPVIPSSRPLDDLKDLITKFVYLDARLDAYEVDLEQPKTTCTKAFLDEIQAMNSPVSGESELEVVEFMPGTPFKDITLSIQKMGCREATLNEAVGYLQARGRTFKNISKADCDDWNGFVVIGGQGCVEFERSSNNGCWEMILTDKDATRAFLRTDVLVAKL